MVQCVQVAADRGAQTRPARTSPRRSGPFRLSRARCARAGTRSSAPGPTGPSGRPPAPGTRRRSAAAPAAAGPRPFRSAPRWNGNEAGFGNAVNNGMTWAAKAFRPLNQIMDLVFVKQRGTAGSGCRPARACSRHPPPSTWPRSAPRPAAAWPRPAGTRATTPPPQPSATWTRFGRHSATTRSTSTARPTASRWAWPTCSAMAATSAPRYWTAARCYPSPLPAGRRARPAGLQPDRQPVRRHLRLRPVLPPRRRPGRHPGPAERPPGPRHPARTRRPAPDSRLASQRTPARLIPESPKHPGFDVIWVGFDTSATIRLRSPSRSPPDASHDAFSSSLTTTVFSQPSMRRFKASLRRATPKGPDPSSPAQHRIRTRPKSAPPRAQETLWNPTDARIGERPPQMGHQRVEQRLPYFLLLGGQASQRGPMQAERPSLYRHHDNSTARPRPGRE